jgi:hypothetical protein
MQVHLHWFPSVFLLPHLQALVPWLVLVSVSVEEQLRAPVSVLVVAHLSLVGGFFY